MHENYEGSRREFLARFSELDGPPAFVVRAQAVESAWESVQAHCVVQRRELLSLSYSRLATLAALVGGQWYRVQPYLMRSEDSDYLSDLQNQWQPTLRVKIRATQSGRRIRSGLKDLIISFTRFNSNWIEFVQAFDLSIVNGVRQAYNDYYVLEKACAFDSERIAEIGFVRLKDLTSSDLLEAFPPLRVPQAAVRQPR